MSSLGECCVHFKTSSLLYLSILPLLRLTTQAKHLPTAVGGGGADERGPHHLHDEHAGPLQHHHQVLDFRALPVGLLLSAGEEGGYVVMESGAVQIVVGVDCFFMKNCFLCVYCFIRI